MAFAPWTAGQRITAQRLNDMVGAWTSYTPTWTADTTNPSLGNGTLEGRYAKIGGGYAFAIRLQFGSTTTAGSGNYHFALPAQASGSMSNQEFTGQGFVGANRYNISGLIQANQTTLSIFAPGSSTASNIAAISSSGLGGNAWASGNEIRISGFYEAA